MHTMAKQGSIIDMSDVPRHVIPLPDPPSDCDSALMSDGSITVSCIDSIIYDNCKPPNDDDEYEHYRRHGDVEQQQQQQQQQEQQQEQQQQRQAASYRTPLPSAPTTKKRVSIMAPEPVIADDDTHPTTSIVDAVDGTKSDVTNNKRLQAEKKNRRLRMVAYCFFGVALTIIVVAVGINVLLYFDNKQQQRTQSQDESSSSSSTATDDSVNGVPGPPTSSPTMIVGRLPTLTPQSIDSVPAGPNGAPVNPPTLAPSMVADMIATIVTDQLRLTLPSDQSAPANRAVSWLVQEAHLEISGGGQVYGNLEKFAQRFALLSVRFALLGTNNASQEDLIPPPTMGVDECQWFSDNSNVNASANIPVTCNDLDLITQLDFSDLNLSGIIASEIRFLPLLTQLDLSNNNLRGSLPETLYDLQNMERLYLYKNQLTGTLSPWIEQWNSIQYLHLSHNLFTGQIPQLLQSDEDSVRPLKYLNLYSNQFTGTIPENLFLLDLEYFDVGRNYIGGTLPVDIGNNFAGLRHLFVDHNRFVGSIPQSYPLAGEGRLISFFASHNQLTGIVPDNWVFFNKLVQYTLHENNFDSLGSLNCNFNVFSGGELVEFKADCDICTCQDVFCDLMCSII